MSLNIVPLIKLIGHSLTEAVEFAVPTYQSVEIREVIYKEMIHWQDLRCGKGMLTDELVALKTPERDHRESKAFNFLISLRRSGDRAILPPLFTLATIDYAALLNLL